MLSALSSSSARPSPSFRCACLASYRKSASAARSPCYEHLQCIGYGIALIGLFIFKAKPEDMAVWLAQLKALVGR